MATAPAQSASYNNQSFDIDVPEMFKQFISGGTTPNDPSDAGKNIGIDDIRGSINIEALGLPTKNIISLLNIDPLASTITPAPGTTPTLFTQESRCHAFYRLIGLPVVGSDRSFYNPGFDAVQKDGVTTNVTLSSKLKIATSVETSFETISKAREAWPTTMAQIFGIPQSVEAGVLALTSGGIGDDGTPIIRQFASPFTVNTVPDPYDMVPAHQQYEIANQNTIVGKNAVTLSTFADSSGYTMLANGNPTTNGTIFNHQHIIVPFMVDPRIDFCIWANESKTAPGLSKRVAVPFVTDSRFLKTGETATAERPLLEKIIINRTSQTITDGGVTIGAGTASADAIAMIQQFKSVQQANIGTSTLSKVFSGQLFTQTPSDYFATYLSVIEALMTKLVDAIQVVRGAQGKYYWLPMPSKNGPESGFSVRKIIISQNVINNSSNLITENDFDIAYAQFEELISRLTYPVAQSTATPDAAGSSASNGQNGNRITLDVTASAAMGNAAAQTNTVTTYTREQQLSTAGQALQVIEMIMGEFSGLGLADIIAITGALYVMDVKYLIGLLDGDAYDRAVFMLGELPAGKGSASVTECLTQLTTTVMQFYQIMDVVFTNTLHHNSQSS